MIRALNYIIIQCYLHSQLLVNCKCTCFRKSAFTTKTCLSLLFTFIVWFWNIFQIELYFKYWLETLVKVVLSHFTHKCTEWVTKFFLLASNKQAYDYFKRHLVKKDMLRCVLKNVNITSFPSFYSCTCGINNINKFLFF